MLYCVNEEAASQLVPACEIQYDVRNSVKNDKKKTEITYKTLCAS